MAAYMILRAFSWHLRLSPVPFPEFCAALGSPDPTPLLDDAHVCLLRALALDEPKAIRNSRTLDLALLDAVTWPEFVWEWLRDSGDPLGVWRDRQVLPDDSADADAAGEQLQEAEQTAGATQAAPVKGEALSFDFLCMQQ